jgi:hypothetical protein
VARVPKTSSGGRMGDMIGALLLAALVAMQAPSPESTAVR